MPRSMEQTKDRKRSRSRDDRSNQRKRNDCSPSPKRKRSENGGNSQWAASTEQTKDQKRRCSGRSSPQDCSNQRKHNENPPSPKQIKQDRKRGARGNSCRDSNDSRCNMPPSSKPSSQKRSDSSERRERSKTTIYSSDTSEISESSDEKRNDSPHLRASQSRSKNNPPIKSKSLLYRLPFTPSPEKEMKRTRNPPLKWVSSSEIKNNEPKKDKPTEQDNDDDLSDIIDCLSPPYSPLPNEEEPLDESHVLRKEIKENSAGILGYMFKKLIKNNNMREIRLPGNGFCFLTGLVITLEELGINKDFPLLASEIMTEIRDNFQTQYKNVIDTEVDTEELFLQRCADYFQKGVYYEDCVDVCIGAAANALGINMNIFRKSRMKSGRGYKEIVTLASMDCSQFRSKVDLFLIYSPGTTKKDLDAHYNCLVNDEYFKTNYKAIQSRLSETKGSVHQQNIK